MGIDGRMVSRNRKEEERIEATVSEREGGRSI